MKQRNLLATVLLFLFACSEGSAPVSEQAPGAHPATPDGPEVEWALAIHGGAGVIQRTMAEEQQKAYFVTLREALALGQGMLEGGANSVDVVEAVVALLEDSPLFNAGKGAVFTNAGSNELDAAIMDGRDLSCGAISGVKTVKNPIRLARKVMTESRHIFFVGDGAEHFATEMGVERVEPEYFFTQRRFDQWRAKVEKERQGEADKHGTVGAVARDREGNLAAATSTGGLTDKRFGRVGDVPVIGAGTYANNRTVAISCTGYGEQFIRNTVAHDVSAIIEYKGLSVEDAARAVIHHKLDPGDGGLIAVGSDGSIALVFNSEGMFRGAADSSGRFDVAIWEDTAIREDTAKAEEGGE